MPYQMKVDGMEEISEMLTQMEQQAPQVAAKALYEGAAVMSKAVRAGAAGIKTAPFKYAKDGESRMPSPEEKAIVESVGAGIAKFDKNGTEVNTSVGYRNAGYAELDGRLKPIPQIVNAINSGTSFMKKQPFVRRAASGATQRAIETMKTVIEAEFNAMNKQ